jgi:phage baseplate assembly protein W
LRTPRKGATRDDKMFEEKMKIRERIADADGVHQSLSIILYNAYGF